MEEGMTVRLLKSNDLDHGRLASLKLSPEDMQALARQGFVAVEFRDHRGPYYKLRWRRGGRQCVRYLGSDPDRAQQVRAALDALQAPHRIGRQVVRLLAEARKRLLEMKRSLTPLAATRGLHYHGYTLRRAAAPPHLDEDTSADSPVKDFGAY
jgi:hypothetical protein